MLIIMAIVFVLGFVVGKWRAVNQMINKAGEVQAFLEEYDRLKTQEKFPREKLEGPPWKNLKEFESQR